MKLTTTNDNDVPTQEKMIEALNIFQKDVNQAISDLQINTPGFPAGLRASLIIQSFFTFPYSWMRDHGQHSNFKDMLQGELDFFLQGMDDTEKQIQAAEALAPLSDVELKELDNLPEDDILAS